MFFVDKSKKKVGIKRVRVGINLEFIMMEVGFP